MWVWIEDGCLTADDHVQLLSTKMAAETIGVTTSQIRRLGREGRLPGIRVGNDWYFRKDDLTSYNEEVDGIGRPRVGGY